MKIFDLCEQYRHRQRTPPWRCRALITCSYFSIAAKLVARLLQGCKPNWNNESIYILQTAINALCSSQCIPPPSHMQSLIQDGWDYEACPMIISEPYMYTSTVQREGKVDGPCQYSTVQLYRRAGQDCTVRVGLGVFSCLALVHQKGVIGVNIGVTHLYPAQLPWNTSVKLG